MDGSGDEEVDSGLYTFMKKGYPDPGRTVSILRIEANLNFTGIYLITQSNPIPHSNHYCHWIYNHLNHLLTPSSHWKRYGKTFLITIRVREGLGLGVDINKINLLDMFSTYTLYLISKLHYSLWH